MKVPCSVYINESGIKPQKFYTVPDILHRQPASILCYVWFEAVISWVWRGIPFYPCPVTAKRLLRFRAIRTHPCSIHWTSLLSPCPKRRLSFNRSMQELKEPYITFISLHSQNCSANCQRSFLAYILAIYGRRGNALWWNYPSVARYWMWIDPGRWQLWCKIPTRFGRNCKGRHDRSMFPHRKFRNTTGQWM